MSSSTYNTDSVESKMVDEKKALNAFPFPIAIDPVRIFAGIIARWFWLFLGALIFGGIGTYAGIQLNRQTFSLSASLIKRKVPQTVQTTEIGQAFRPADFNDSTLLATLLATEPIDLSIKRLNNGLSSETAKTKVEASQLDNTDIFYITYHSPFSSKDAVDFTKIWSEEILEYTKRLQQSEARSVRNILLKEVTSLAVKIDQIDKRIVEFAKANDFTGNDTQVASILGKISQIELKLGDAIAEKESLLEQIQQYREKIQFHGPLEMRLREAQQERANLRATYTDENPLVKTQLESIAYFKKQIEELNKKDKIPLESFTGTELGNTIYLNIIGTKNRLIDAENRISSLKEQKINEVTELARFPSIIAQHRVLEAKRDSLLSELSLLSKRLKETEIFASSSPGYWQVLEQPDIRKVVPSSLIKKPLILGIAGAIFGTTSVLLFALLITQRSSRRSLLECCATTKVGLIAHFPEIEDQTAAYTDFWLKRVASQVNNNSPILIWTAALSPSCEKHFWINLAKAAKLDTGHNLEVSDLTPENHTSKSQSSSTLKWTESHKDCQIWRANGLPIGRKRDLLKSIETWYVVVETEKSSLKKFSETKELTEVYLPACCGTLAIVTPAKGFFRRKADQISLFIANSLS